MRTMLLAAAAVPVALAAQERCPTEWRWNSIGVDAFHCGGGHCAYEMNRTGPGIGFTFSAEPRLRAVDPAGPSAGRLEEGDVLVAVNERLIVTLLGGGELGGLPADRDARITVRRGDQLVAVEVRPRTTCRTPMLLIGENVVESATSSRSAVDGASMDLSRFPNEDGSANRRPLGISIRCAECGFSVRVRQPPPNRIILTVGSVYPVIASLERDGMADRAGLLRGDEIRRISGLDVREEPGTSLLVTPPQGEFDVDIIRDGRAQRVRVGSPLRVDRRIDPDAPKEIRIVRQGDTVRSDDVLGAVVRWWRSIPRDQSAPALLLTRGDAWGDADLGFLVGADRLRWSHNVATDQQSWSFERPLRVVEVINQSLADRAGLRKDDVITHANDLDVHTEAGARALLLTPRRSPVVLRVQRDGREVTVTIPPRAL